MPENEPSAPMSAMSVDSATPSVQDYQISLGDYDKSAKKNNQEMDASSASNMLEEKGPELMKIGTMALGGG